MRRIAAIAAAALVVALVIFLPGALGGNGGAYEVRGIFENGSFVVKGEEVRVAGARVGTVQQVGISDDGEIVSRQGGDHAVPGKAVIVMRIDNPAFRDFRVDASCTIRPQSLIGERYVDCSPTQPRAPGEPPPPRLQVIPPGQPGAGQRLLPLENDTTTVDLDLIQNIQRISYRDRFRLILNELGAGVAARGSDLAQIIDRADPALLQTDRVLNILAQQRRQLADLAGNGDRVLEPLARNRANVTGFMRNGAIVAGATAERGTDLERALAELPATLHQVRLTMGRLKDFADQGTPVFADLKASGANISKAAGELGPFARAAIPALTTLGSAAETAGPKLASSDSLLADIAATGSAAVPVGNNLSSLLDTFTKTQGFQSLADFVYHTTAATNGFDSFGHFLRLNFQVTNCNEVVSFVLQGCEAFFQHAGGTQAQTKKHKKGKKKRAASITRLRSGLAPSPAPKPRDTQALLQFLLGSGS